MKIEVRPYGITKTLIPNDHRFLTLKRGTLLALLFCKPDPDTIPRPGADYEVVGSAYLALPRAFRTIRDVIRSMDGESL